MNLRKARIRGAFRPSGFRGPAVGLLNRAGCSRGETYANLSIDVTPMSSFPCLGLLPLRRRVAATRRAPRGRVVAAFQRPLKGD